MEPQRVVVVDVANVVGSRPDGWWRDRLGATQRLLDRLAELAGTEGPHVQHVAVVEGAGARAREVEGVVLVRASAGGDDAVVATVEDLLGRIAPDEVLVVTADRGLRERLPPGVLARGPGWLLSRLPAGRPAG